MDWLKGIGPWTEQYALLRGFEWVESFASGWFSGEEVYGAPTGYQYRECFTVGQLRYVLLLNQS